MHFPKSLLGLIIIILGIVALFTVIGIGFMLIGPLVLFILGIILLNRKHRLVGITLIVLGCVSLVSNLLHVNFGGLIIALLFLYIGYYFLIKNKKDKDHMIKTHDFNSDTLTAAQYKNANSSNEYTGPKMKNSFVGELHMMHERFDLEDMNIWHGIGDVKIDLTRASIPQGETVLIINGWIGDIDIYIPYDLEVSVTASVTLGDLNIMNEKASGFQKDIAIASNEFKEATHKVKIILSLFIGDIDVRVM